MGAPEYEITKEYEISGIRVSSEIVKDQDAAEYRAVVVRSSCPSHRWGTRTQNHSLTHYNNPASDFVKNLEQVRLQAAEALAKTELGEISEIIPKVLGIQIHGPIGRTVNTFAVSPRA